MMDSAARGVMDIARSVLSELDLDYVLDHVLESARALTGARYAALGVLSESKTDLARFITTGIDEPARTEIGALPRGRGVLGELIANPAPLRLSDIGAHPHSYGFPQGHPPMSTFLGVPIIVDGQLFGNLYLTEKSGGGEFTEADEEAVVTLAELAALAIDHARRYTGASNRRDELERTVAALEAMTQIARALGGQTDLNVILELVAKRGRALVDARLLVIELVNAGNLVIAAGAGEMPDALLGRQLSESAAGAALRTLRAQRLDEPLTRARFDEHGLGSLGVKAQDGLLVPLIFQNRAYGVLIAIDRIDRGPSFTPEDERLLEAFAASAATAVATAHSVAAERRRQSLAAAEAERQRWARELHDDTLQSLSALRVGLSSAKRSGRTDAIEQAVTKSIEQLEDAITNLRALITDLRPASLDELGAGSAIQVLGERALRTGVEVDMSIDLAYESGRAQSRHVPELEIAMYRLVQEALTNAIKHGKARRVAVEVHEQDTDIQITVRDDGSGFDPGLHTDGFGLLGMHERVQLLDGSLHISSAPGRGTTVTASLPIRRTGEMDQAGKPIADSSGSAGNGAMRLSDSPLWSAAYPQ